MSACPDRFLLKPCNPADLVTTIERALGITAQDTSSSDLAQDLERQLAASVEAERRWSGH
jgi:FixJ family two-component response regulator